MFRDGGEIYIVIVFMVGAIGLLANGTAMFILYKGGRLGQAFQQICFSHCISNSLVLMSFVFYCTPVMILNATDFANSIYAKVIGGMMIALWDVGVYSHLITSLNRLITISWPVEAAKIVTVKRTRMVLVCAWILGFTNIIPYFKFDECYITFSPSSYLWAFAENSCGFLIGHILDFYPGVAVSSTIGMIDMFILFRLHYIKSKSHGSQRLAKREILYFIQSIVQFTLLCAKKVFFYVISTYFLDKPVPLFFCTTFTWATFHCLDGAALIPFHIGDFLRKMRGDPSNPGIITTNMRSSTTRPQTIDINSITTN